MLRLLARERKSPANDLPDQDFCIPGHSNKQEVVVVMDGMTEFTTEPLQWALDNLVTTGCIVTLVGVMPWLNIPLFLKTRNNFWTVELEDEPQLKENREYCANSVKCLKRQVVIDLCRKYGVVPQKKMVMGYPRKQLVVEQIVNLCPTWVVFDSSPSHKRNKKFYARKIPCNTLMMNDDGKVDMIKSRLMIHKGETISRESPMSSAPTSQLTVLSEESNEAS